MNQIEKLKAEIERRKKIHQQSYKQFHDERFIIDECEDDRILSFIESLQKPSIEDCADALLNALSKSPYNNKPITDAQVVVKKLLVFLKEPNKYNPDAILQEPEVDLEKELDAWRHEHFRGRRDNKFSGEYLERKSQLDLARHFYELGRQSSENIGHLPKNKGWVARFADGSLGISREKPFYYEEEGKTYISGFETLDIDKSLFPDLHWLDEPIEVELIIREVK